MEKQQKNGKPADHKNREQQKEKQITDPGIKAEMEIRKEKNKPATNNDKRKK